MGSEVNPANKLEPDYTSECMSRVLNPDIEPEPVDDPLLRKDPEQVDPLPDLTAEIGPPVPPSLITPRYSRPSAPSDRVLRPRDRIRKPARFRDLTFRAEFAEKHGPTREDLGKLAPYPSHWMTTSFGKPGSARINRLNLTNWKETPLVVSTLEASTKDNPRPPPVAADGKYPDYEDYARTYGLLMREECLSSLRNGLQEYVAGRDVPPSVPMYGPVLQFERVTPTTTGLWLVIRVAWKSRPLRTNLWFGNLVYFVSGGELLTTATVRSKRNFPEKKYSQITLELGGRVDRMVQILQSLLAIPAEVFIIEDPSYYRALEPAIRRFQSGGPCPLWDTLGGTQMEPPKYMCSSEDDIAGVVRNLLTVNGNLDPSQKEAVLSAFDRQVSMIQGPPGSGKTHVAIELMKILDRLPIPDGLPILIVTHRNRPLNDVFRKLGEVFPPLIASGWVKSPSKTHSKECPTGRLN